MRSAKDGDHSGALSAYETLAEQADLRPFAEVCADHFASLKRTVGGVQWTHSKLQPALAASRRTGKPVLVLFDQENCPPCMMLKRSVVTAPEFVRAVTESCVTLNLNACSDDDLAKRFGVPGTPTLLVLDAEGNVLGNQTGVKPLPASLQFLRTSVLAATSKTEPEPAKKKYF